MIVTTSHNRVKWRWAMFDGSWDLEYVNRELDSKAIFCSISLDGNLYKADFGGVSASYIKWYANGKLVGVGAFCTYSGPYLTCIYEDNSVTIVVDDISPSDKDLLRVMVCGVDYPCDTRFLADG